LLNLAVSNKHPPQEKWFLLIADHGQVYEVIEYFNVLGIWYGRTFKGVPIWMDTVLSPHSEAKAEARNLSNYST
jgi:hypothetical protein